MNAAYITPFPCYASDLIRENNLESDISCQYHAKDDINYKSENRFIGRGKNPEKDLLYTKPTFSGKNYSIYD